MKYLLLKHYRGGPTPNVDFAPMDQWTPKEVDAHMQYMHDFGARLEETGEFVDVQGLAPGGAFVRYDGEGRPPVTDGPFAETKEALAGFYLIDARDLNEAIQLAAKIPPARFGSIEVRPTRELAVDPVEVERYAAAAAP